MPDATQPSWLSQTWTRLKSWGETARRVALKGLRAVYRHAASVVSYYRSHGLAFKEYFSEFAVGLQSSKIRRREIRISEHDEIANAWRTGDGWHVELPDCCVACGRPTDRDWTTETISVPEVAWPFWAPIAGFLAGFVLMLFAQWFWLWPIGLLVGFLYGYDCRKGEQVAIRFRRCDQHADVKRVPHLRLFSEFLIVRVGSQPVKQQFLQAQHGGAGTILEPAPEIKSDSPPATIPLEEGESSATIEHDDRPMLKDYHASTEDFPFRVGDSIELGESGRGPGPLREYQPEETIPAPDNQQGFGDTVSLESDADEQPQDNQGNEIFGRGESISPDVSGEGDRCPSCGADIVLHETRCPECNAQL